MDKQKIKSFKDEIVFVPIQQAHIVKNTLLTAELVKPTIILYAIIGGGVGFLLFLSISAGFFTKWQLLGTFPEKNVNLVGAVENSIYVVINDEDYFDCSTHPKGCRSINYEDINWELIQEHEFAYTENKISCDTFLPEFFFLFSPAKNAVDCHQVIMHYDDGLGRGSFIINESSELWGWFHISSSFDTQLQKIYYPLVAAIIFVIVGTALRVLKNNNSNI